MYSTYIYMKLQTINKYEDSHKGFIAPTSNIRQIATYLTQTRHIIPQCVTRSLQTQQDTK